MATVDSKSSSLKMAQLKAIHRMLAFNQDADYLDGTTDDDQGEFRLPPAGSSSNQWKILIYDTHCRSIISPLMSVSQLRKRGVTLHLLLHSDREPIPDVPAVYFCCPTAENLARIAQDCVKGLYGRAHLNFCSKLSRPLMEEFCKLLVQTSTDSNALESIASVHDQYVDFVCLERHLFSLNQTNSYVTYNSSNDALIEQTMSEIANGLFSVVATLGHSQPPVIRCPKNGAPEMVGRKLHRMIAEHPALVGKKAVSSSSTSFYRPLVVILDRNADMITPLQHTSTYQALIDDLLQHQANRVEFQIVLDPKDGDSKKATKPVVKKFDLDPDNDPFYSRHKFHPFPEAIESNGIDLQEVTEREHEIRSRTTGGADTSTTVVVQQENSATTDLVSAVDSLPALLDRKKQLEVHTSILQAVMNQVAARDVPQFYELESSLVVGSYNNNKSALERAKKDVLDLISDPQKGNLLDKIRMVIIFCLVATKSAKQSADLDQMIQALEQFATTQQPNSSAGGRMSSMEATKLAKEQLTVGLRAISYARQLRSIHMIPTTLAEALPEVTSTVGSAPSSERNDIFSSFMAKATHQATGLLAKATDKVMTSMLGLQSHKQYVTRVVENLCDMKPNTEDDDYLYLDPKVSEPIRVAEKFRGAGDGAGGTGVNTPGGAASSGSGVVVTRAPIRQVIVFVIGGGCYAEYQNLQTMMLVNHKSTTIFYGSTELTNADTFIAQLGQMGN